MTKFELLISIVVFLALSSCAKHESDEWRVAAAVATERAEAAETAPVDPDCPVTRANDQGHITPTLQLRHGNEWLATSVYPDGTVDFKPGGAGCVDDNGTLWVKWPWWRKVPGELEVETRSLDGRSASLKAKTICCYGTTGFQPVAVAFPGRGCWNVTARVGRGALSFVTRVEKDGVGPRPCDTEAAAQR